MGFSVGGIVHKVGDITKALVPGHKDYLDFNGSAGNPAGPTQAQKIRTAQDKIALAELTGGRGVHTTKATNLLSRTGSSLTSGDAYAYLAKLTGKGGVAGKKAAYLAQLIAMENTGNAAELAATRGQDDVAKAYQTTTDAFTGALGPGVDVNSPALLDAVRRYTEGRSTDTTSLLTNLKQQEMTAQNAILLGQIAPTLDATGALVESLKMLKEEQDSLNRAKTGSLIGGGLGALGGFFLGGPAGAATGYTVGSNVGAGVAS